MYSFFHLWFEEEVLQNWKHLILVRSHECNNFYSHIFITTILVNNQLLLYMHNELVDFTYGGKLAHETITTRVVWIWIDDYPAAYLLVELSSSKFEIKLLHKFKKRILHENFVTNILVIIIFSFWFLVDALFWLGKCLI